MHTSNSNSANSHPAQSANIFSTLTLAWFRTVCYKSFNKTFKISDLYECLENDKCEELGNKLEKNWNHEISLAKTRNLNPSLLKAILKTFMWKYLFYSLILLFQFVIMTVAKPIVLEILINLFSLDKNEISNKNKLLYIYGGGLVLITLLGIIIEYRTLLSLMRIGMQITSACSSLILRLSKKSLTTVSSGHVINLLSNDVHKFDTITSYLMYLWIAPIFFVVSAIFVCKQMQLAGLIGIMFFLIVQIPLNVITSSLTTKWHFDVLKLTDKRVRQISEIISGIKTIKMHAWEKPFSRLVKTTRNEEMKIISKILYIFGVLHCSEIFIERLSLFIILVTFVSMGNTLTADKVFSTSLIINILQSSVVVSFPIALNVGAESLVSIRRLQNFLLLEEKPDSSLNNSTSSEISFNHVRFSWIPQKAVLSDLSVNIKPGSLCAIVGPVGSGKSTILHLLMGELLQDKDNITIGGKIAYCAQKPWLFSATVQQNILFGQPYDSKLYKNTIKVCALEKDLELFPERDHTFIGENGIKLSGGQKARINLARTIYRKANIYLLDDPLSALDAHVGKELFENCIMQFLKNKTRILVTHQLNYLHNVDYIVVVNKGKIEARGTYKELLNIKTEFTKLFASTRDQKFSCEEKPFESASVNSESITKCEESVVPNSEKLIYWEYIKYGRNNVLFCMTIFFLMLGQFWGNVSDFWITAWTSQNSLSQFSLNSTYEPSLELLGFTLSTNAEYIFIYAALIGGCIVFLILGSIYFYKHSTWTSINLHKDMLTSLLQTSIQFFDTESNGKLLTRFSRDTRIVDEVLPSAIYRGVQTILVSIGILIMLSITNPYMILAILILSIPCNKLRCYYSSVSRYITFLKVTSESYIFSHKTATLDGVSTIRNSEMQDVLIKEFNMLRDRTTSANYLFLVLESAFSMWIDAICCFLLFCLIFSFIVMVQYNVVNTNYIGLAISQTLILTATVANGLLQIAEGVCYLTSVERILEYTKLQKEQFLITSHGSVKLWPHKGQLRFLNVSLKYFSSKTPVLKNVNFTVNPCEKVGIVGRTAAGKSSLISALFRLVPFQGNIIIDDRDIQTVPLEELRSNISVIPQEPILFSGTLRYNLDPHRQFSDEEVHNALEDVQLTDVNYSLDYLVSENGDNFSVGQKQLICLARAILRRTKILVLDEATANVDYKTDELIQETIKKNFRKCTVLTIAHRLNTIMNSDKVLVMDAGEIVEYDQPIVLLQNKNGYFYKLASETDFQN